MNHFTVVIAPGGARSAAGAAEEILAIAAPDEGVSYWKVGFGWAAERFAAAGLPEAGESGVLPLFLVPSPVPEPLVPSAIITPDFVWHWQPAGGHAVALWPELVATMFARWRRGHSYVAADVHF